jgi:ribulose-5-phosphate 4-epimerase/fuculose-1-phosphate aldolase
METLASLRTDLTAALRWAAHLGLNEGVCNHFSVEVVKDRYLINPQGVHWSEVCASDLLLIDNKGTVIDGKHPLEPTAFFLHAWIHKLNPTAKVVRHTHMPYATALTLVQDGKLAWCNQNALRFYNRIAYDNKYNGLALDDAEGQRISSQFRGRDVLFMASHGITVVGPSIAWAFDDLYYLERAAMHQCLATQMANGQKLREIPGPVAERVCRQIACERQQSVAFFDSIKRMLDRQAPGWRE